MEDKSVIKILDSLSIELSPFKIIFSVSDSNYYIFTATNGDHNLILWWNSGLPANTHSSTSADGTAGFGTLVADVPDDGGYAYTYFLKKISVLNFLEPLPISIVRCISRIQPSDRVAIYWSGSTISIF